MRYSIAVVLTLILGCNRSPVKVDYVIINPYPAKLLFIPDRSAPYPKELPDGTIQMVFDPAKPIKYNPAIFPEGRWMKETAHDQNGTPITTNVVVRGSKFAFSLQTTDSQNRMTAEITSLP